MLNLASATDPAWAARALLRLDDILLDHAHCEKRAAATAVGLLFRYPDRQQLLSPLARLAREELAHFDEVLRHLTARGQRFARQTPSPYAAELIKVVRSREPQRLLDTLLCCALIEARSCERMKLLAQALREAAAADPARTSELTPLAELYQGLLASEARHHQSYVDLALAYQPRDAVYARLHELAAHEAAVLAQGPPLPRLHSAA